METFTSVTTDVLGEATLEEALRDLMAGVREEGCANCGPIVEAYLSAAGHNGPGSWCAAAASAWMIRAGQRIGVTVPFKPTAGAKNIMYQLQTIGRWLPPDTDPRWLGPGMMVVWDRSSAPGLEWQGHVGVLERVADANNFTTIDGNTGPDGTRVWRNERKFSNPKLLGFGLLSGPMPWNRVAPASLGGVGLATVAVVILAAAYVYRQNVSE